MVALFVALALATTEEARPSEEDMFAAPVISSPVEPEPQATPASTAGEQKTETALAVGGQLYLRAETLWQEEVDSADWPLSTPNLLDLYADARPNDRVRAFVLGRMLYNPVLGADGATTSMLALPTLAAPTVANPRVMLDQLWIRFDVGRRLFVTAGRQHAKWGVGKFWNPTDYLHPAKRDPLAVFDERVGTSMVKLHWPWEAMGWNAYGILFLEDIAGKTAATDTLGRVGCGGRVEMVAGTFELGVDALAQRERKPRFGVDLSAGIWEVDLYAELALQVGTDTPRWREIDAAAILNERFDRRRHTGAEPRLVVGGDWGRNYSDEDAIHVGVEYFFNPTGYDDPKIYPFLLAGAPEFTGEFETLVAPRDARAFTPFYLGRHYGALYAFMPSPGSWNDTTFRLSVLGNLSDESFIVRFDHSVLVNTYLTVQTYVTASGGKKGGELRLGLDVEPTLVVGDPVSGFYSPGYQSAAPVLYAGLAIRVAM